AYREAGLRYCGSRPPQTGAVFVRLPCRAPKPASAWDRCTPATQLRSWRSTGHAVGHGCSLGPQNSDPAAGLRPVTHLFPHVFNELKELAALDLYAAALELALEGVGKVDLGHESSPGANRAVILVVTPRRSGVGRWPRGLGAWLCGSRSVSGAW